MLKLTENTTIEEIISEAIDKCPDEFTAYNVTTEVHEILRHINIRQLVHNSILKKKNVSRTSKNSIIINNKSVQAIVYNKNCPNISKNKNTNRLIIKMENLSEGDRIYLMGNNTEGYVVLTTDYYAFDSLCNVLASYYVSADNKVDVNESRIVDALSVTNYDISIEGNDIYFTKG